MLPFMFDVWPKCCALVVCSVRFSMLCAIARKPQSLTKHITTSLCNIKVLGWYF